MRCSIAPDDLGGNYRRGDGADDGPMPSPVVGCGESTVTLGTVTTGLQPALIVRGSARAPTTAHLRKEDTYPPVPKKAVIYRFLLV